MVSLPAVCVRSRSELLSTVKLADPALLVGSGSLVGDVTEAILAMVDPSATPKFTLA